MLTTRLTKKTTTIAYLSKRWMYCIWADTW